MILGDRVRLRPIGRADLPALRRWMDDPEAMRCWGAPAPLVTPDAFEHDLAGRFARFDSAGYFIVEDESAIPIGRIEFERLDERAGSAEVMILIGEASARGRGLGTDAMTALLRYLFQERNLHRVHLAVIADNARAIRSYEKAGFVVDGRLRDDLFFGGQWRDQLVMSILQPEFAARHGASTPPTDVA